MGQKPLTNQGILDLGCQRPYVCEAVGLNAYQCTAHFSSEGRWVAQSANDYSVPTSVAKRVPGFIVRPFFGYETARWLPDSHRLLCKVLPSGLSQHKQMRR